MISADQIKDRAKTLGFDLCGIAPATVFPELARLREWLDRGFAGEMLYLHKSADTRADIRNFLPSAKSVIVTGTLYYTDPAKAGSRGSDSEARATQSPRSGVSETRGAGLPPSHEASPDRRSLGALSQPGRTGRIARYAWGADYHLVLAERLQALVEWMREEHHASFDASIFVDKHHVQERVFAKQAGLGWIGKNTCLINPEIGSWVFLAGVVVSLDLTPDRPGPDQCGACTLCIDACPTGALVNEYEMDATKCISYLTIELHDAVPADQRASIGDHVFGCDICQEVCPWNLAPLATIDEAWQPRAGRDRIDAASLWQRSDFELHGLVADSAMTRTSLSRLRRNLAVVLGNSGDPSAAAVLDRPGGGKRRAAQSAENRLVQEHVEWAKRALTRAGSRLSTLSDRSESLAKPATPKAES